GYRPEKDYAVRRMAADMVVPLILNHKLAYEFSKSLKYVKDKEPMIRDMKEYWRDIKEIIEVYG
ncbi:MAG: hypothetical protein QXM83_04720, partial [Ignisphaera sp.]